MLLPTERTPPERVSPKILVIFSKPKVGKTTALAQLPDTLLIDLEGGALYVESMKIDIKAIALRENKPEFNVLIEVVNAIKAKQVADGKPPYLRIALDTVTALEDMVHGYALSLYKNTPMGVNYKGEILKLPNGGGYMYLREAFFNTLNNVYPLANEIILLGHLKDTTIEKDGKEISSKELDLTGKLKSLLSAKVDAIGLLYREGDKCILSFKTTDAVVCGARPDHLKNREIVLTEMVDGKITNNWNQIYID